MGTIVTIDVYTPAGEASDDIRRQLGAARGILQQADAVFSTWKPESSDTRSPSRIFIGRKISLSASLTARPGEIPLGRPPGLPDTPFLNRVSTGGLR